MAEMHQRIRTAAWFAENSPVLQMGEYGLESDTGRVKVGDGKTKWNSLKYKSSTSPGSGSGEPTEPIPGGGFAGWESSPFGQKFHKEDDEVNLTLDLEATGVKGGFEVPGVGQAFYSLNTNSLEIVDDTSGMEISTSVSYEGNAVRITGDGVDARYQSTSYGVKASGMDPVGGKNFDIEFPETESKETFATREWVSENLDGGESPSDEPDRIANSNLVFGNDYYDTRPGDFSIQRAGESGYSVIGFDRGFQRVRGTYIDDGSKWLVALTPEDGETFPSESILSATNANLRLLGFTGLGEGNDNAFPLGPDSPDFIGFDLVLPPVPVTFFAPAFSEHHNDQKNGFENVNDYYMKAQGPLSGMSAVVMVTSTEAGLDPVTYPINIGWEVVDIEDEVLEVPVHALSEGGFVDDDGALITEFDGLPSSINPNIYLRIDMGVGGESYLVSIANGDYVSASTLKPEGIAPQSWTTIVECSGLDSDHTYSVGSSGIWGPGWGPSTNGAKVEGRVSGDEVFIRIVGVEAVGASPSESIFTPRHTPEGDYNPDGYASDVVVGWSTGTTLEATAIRDASGDVVSKFVGITRDGVTIINPQQGDRLGTFSGITPIELVSLRGWNQ